MLYLNNPFVKTDEITLYDLVGQKFTDVEVDENYKKIILVPDLVFSNEYPYGEIIDQRPRSGTNVKVGSSVRLTVSKGQEEVTIPDLVGIASSRAQADLRDLGLKPVETENRVFSDNVPAGCIISIEPVAGTVVGSGTTITLQISNGAEPRYVTIPDVRGLSEEAAKALLESKKLKLGSVTTQPSELPKGTIVSQSPASGTLLSEGGTVALVVSDGGMMSYSISIPLPKNMNRDVLIRARSGEEAESVVAEDTLNPAAGGAYWTPSFKGIPGQVMKVSIYVDKELYQVYYLDFDTGESWLSVDRSDIERFQQ